MNYDSINIGDYLHVRIVNNSGDRNLHGAELFGTVVEKYEPHRMVKLNSGWCCHEKDEVIEHRAVTK